MNLSFCQLLKSLWFESTGSLAQLCCPRCESWEIMLVQESPRARMCGIELAASCTWSPCWLRSAGSAGSTHLHFADWTVCQASPPPLPLAPVSPLSFGALGWCTRPLASSGLPELSVAESGVCMWSLLSHRLLVELVLLVCYYPKIVPTRGRPG